MKRDSSNSSRKSAAKADLVEEISISSDSMHKQKPKHASDSDDFELDAAAFMSDEDTPEEKPKKYNKYAKKPAAKPAKASVKKGV